MTAAAWVRWQRFRLAVLGVTRAVAWAGAVLFVVLAIGTLLLGRELHVVGWLVASATLAVLLWRERFVVSSLRVALWLEERLPALRYALVTAIDPRYAAVLGPRVGPMLRDIDTHPVLRRAALRSVLPAVVGLAASAAVYAAVSARSPVMRPATHAGAPGAADESATRLEPLSATVMPPSYALEAGLEAETVHEPTTISALAGSTIELEGPGTPDGLGVQLGDSALAASDGGDGGDAGDAWRVSFKVADSATAVWLEDRGRRRTIVIAPVHDRPPTVQLVSPARDTTVREPTGSVTLDARLTDDIALGDARFEYIVASGEFEGSFTHREGVLGARRFSDPVRRHDRLELEVPLSTFELGPGDVLSLRAVAADRNDWNGPGIGYSEPRVLRVARPGEYDSLAVEPAPPPVDSALMTLRWLIELVERLDASRGDLPREVFVDSSRTFGALAEALRVRVQQLQNDQTMGGMFEPDSLLSTAYLALVQGEAALEIAEPGESLPHLWDALEALQEYAEAARYYLRGVEPEVLVDLARVRLAGADTGQATPRSPRGIVDTTRVRLRSAFTDAIAWLDVAPDSARERLALMQLEALRHEPSLAAALGEVVEVLQRGGDPAASLQRVRRLLDGPALVSDTLPAWSGAW